MKRHRSQRLLVRNVFIVGNLLLLAFVQIVAYPFPSVEAFHQEAPLSPTEVGNTIADITSEQGRQTYVQQSNQDAPQRADTTSALEKYRSPDTVVDTFYT
jgi:hypothetical protein